MSLNPAEPMIEVEIVSRTVGADTGSTTYTFREVSRFGVRTWADKKPERSWPDTTVLDFVPPVGWRGHAQFMPGETEPRFFVHERPRVTTCQ